MHIFLYIADDGRLTRNVLKYNVFKTVLALLFLIKLRKIPTNLSGYHLVSVIVVF